MTQLQKFISILNLNIKAQNFYFKIISTKFILSLVKLLIKHNYFIGFKRCSYDYTKIIIFFKLNLEQNSLLFSSCQQISKPSRPVYFKKNQWPINSTSLLVLSTERGLMTHKEASFYNIGGLVLFKLI